MTSEKFHTLLGRGGRDVWMFVMRLSHSGWAFYVAFGNQAQESPVEGHVRAFKHFVGLPGVRYAVRMAIDVDDLPGVPPVYPPKTPSRG